MAEKSKTEVKVEEVAEPKPGEVSVPSLDSTDQSRALLHYKLTGVKGDYVDQSADQEWDIAPEFGVGPHPELQNVVPPDVFPSRQSPGAGQPAPVHNAAVAAKVLPIEEKVKAGEEAAKNAASAPSLAAGRPDLRGNAVVNQENEAASKSKSDKD